MFRIIQKRVHDAAHTRSTQCLSSSPYKILPYGKMLSIGLSGKTLKQAIRGFPRLMDNRENS
jgi:hypothetical protein